jgi:hypothetical protein
VENERQRKRRGREKETRKMFWILSSTFGFLRLRVFHFLFFCLRIEGKKKQLFPMAVPDEFQATHSVSLLFAAGR